MFLECIKSEGLAHLSWLVGDGDRAAVIDPRRDIEVYIQAARQRNARITHVIETHRHEDFVSGARALAGRCGAWHLHGPGGSIAHGETARDGDLVELGSVQLSVLHTPGHTPESISLVLRDCSTGQSPLGVFTGDLLFVGSVGRTDLVDDRESAARQQYRSIFGRVLPLGDGVMLWPAHGAGSVCGSGMADRDFSTLGYEKRHNAALQARDEEGFVAERLAEQPPHPPYFSNMEKLNRTGSLAPLGNRTPAPMTPDVFASAREEGMQVLDVRMPEAFGGAFVPGSLCIPLPMIPGFAGYFLAYAQPIGLVCDRAEDAADAQRLLQRLGYDDIRGWLAGGVVAWATAGRPYHAVPSVEADELTRRIQAREPFTLLDVREEHELEEEGVLPGALHIFLGDLPDNLHRIPDDKPLVTFCASGKRAVIAASILKRCGFRVVENALGSMAACKAVGCPTETVQRSESRV